MTTTSQLRSRTGVPADVAVRELLETVQNFLRIRARTESTLRSNWKPVETNQTSDGVRGVLSRPNQRTQPRRPDWAADLGNDAFGTWAKLSICNAAQRLRWIPAGSFQMGSPPNESGRCSDEGPRHRVRISRGFWMFDTPCTQALWQAVAHTNPSRFKHPDRPVETVSWTQCQRFIDRLSRLVPGFDVTLPTEAEWEYACRAGSTWMTYTGDLCISGARAAELDGVAWYAGNSKAGTHRVARSAANRWGLYDMLGNVREWCHDGNRAYQALAVVDPIGPAEMTAHRVARGGSWQSAAQSLRSSCRESCLVEVAECDLGFRCCLRKARLSPNRDDAARAKYPAAPALPATLEAMTPMMEFAYEQIV